MEPILSMDGIPLHAWEESKEAMQEADFCIIVTGTRNDNGTMEWDRNACGLNSLEFFGLIEDLKMAVYHELTED